MNAKNPDDRPQRPEDAQPPKGARSKSSRRDFLRGKSALQAMGDLIVHALPADFPGEPDEFLIGDSYLLHASRPAMACQFEVLLNVGQYADDMQAALDALDRVAALEEQLSYFRPTSELSRINQLAGQGPVEIEPRLFEVLQQAVELSAATSGAFDITSTPLWEAWGFARRQGAIPTPGEIAAAMRHVGSRKIALDAARKTVRFLDPEVRLNLGSGGKGYALDRCVEKLLAAGIEHFMIHGGQSSIVTRGWRGPAPDKQQSPAGWTVGLRHPLRPERRIGQIRLVDRALGTSGSQFQSFWHEGKRYGHIVDPRSGWPAQTMYAVTVVAPTGWLADALSTAFYVMTADEVAAYCRAHPDLGAILFCPARKPGGMEIKTIGLSPDDVSFFGAK